MKRLLHQLKRVKFREFIQCWKLPIAAIVSLFFKIKHRHMWIVCEDPNEARDNGYWFYRYVHTTHPEQECVYAINPKSPDFGKIKEIGPWVKYGSLKHWIMYLASEKKISSQKAGNPNAAVFYFLEVYGLLRDKRIFLQHGVIINDLKWLYYDVTKMKRFICGAFPEYEFIRDTFGYPAGNVVYTGICRFDGLHEGVKHDGKIILIMPTWREWIADEDERFLKYEGTREITKTDYFLKWVGFISNPELSRIAKEYNCKFVFYPHRNMQKYIQSFPESTEYMEIADASVYDVQWLMKNSSMMITDYSSVFVDMLYMKKPVVFYQFDYDKFRAGQYGEGYFSYRDNPFAKSFETQEDTVNAIERIASNGFSVSESFETAHREFFKLYDTNNCERVYNVVKEV